MNDSPRRNLRAGAARAGVLAALVIAGLLGGVPGASGDAAAPRATAAENWIHARLATGVADPAPQGALATLSLAGRLQRAPREGSAGRSVSTSRLKAIGASMLLPGWGQLLTGHAGRARVFLAAEAAILISYVAFNVQGVVRKNGYVDYAEQFAGVANADQRPDWYYRNLAEYNSSADYVDDIERTARAMYGYDLEKRREYVEQNTPGPDEAWEWPSNADRLEYRSRRKSSRNSFRSATHVLGIALLNRLVSAVDAAISASRAADDRALYYQPTPDGGGYVCMQWMLD